MKINPKAAYHQTKAMVAAIDIKIKMRKDINY